MGVRGSAVPERHRRWVIEARRRSASDAGVEVPMKYVVTGLVVLLAVGCQSSTGPAGFTLHAEVVNTTTFPNYWVNQPFSWTYLNAQNTILDQGTITILSDSACITPPV